jgi:hypothetical protein
MKPLALVSVRKETQRREITTLKQVPIFGHSLQLGKLQAYRKTQIESELKLALGLSTRP